MSTINGLRLKILAMLFLFVPQESWDLQLRIFGYITCGFPRIFSYVLQVIKYFISVPLPLFQACLRELYGLFLYLFAGITNAGDSELPVVAYFISALLLQVEQITYYPGYITRC